ncbi:MerR family transcriptional regulator [Frigidibacter mobilis]|uniref:MerR family transcriptional regulator n=1 Tax=Frigidibacter mobilis TaxID=1335048 RepID=A0A159Z5T5_9RHOB|nr:MerR family transcriptional regulator [Frigidibacter mobilis]
MGDGQQTQLARTLDVARGRLAEMERQHQELGEAIAELKEQIGDGEERIASASTKSA